MYPVHLAPREQPDGSELLIVAYINDDGELIGTSVTCDGIAIPLPADIDWQDIAEEARERAGLAQRGWP